MKPESINALAQIMMPKQSHMSRKFAPLLIKLVSIKDLMHIGDTISL